jgi:short-subunit dehydrogenase
MQSFFYQKVVLVTGGTDGIGKALVETLLAMGAYVSTCGRNSDKLENLQKEFISKELLCVRTDVSTESDCKHFIDETIFRFGKIDVLINNAGISMRSLMADCDTAVIKKVMDINFMGTVYCTMAAMPHIIAQKGIVVGVSSIAGYRGLPGRSGYSASKFALNGWLESIKTELSPLGVHVMWVAPGFTRSNIRNAALNEKNQAQGESPLDEAGLMSAEDCAAHILRAVATRRRTLVLSFKGKQTVWLSKFLPSLTDKLIRKFFFKEGQLVK